MQQETKRYVSDIIGITEVAPKAALQLPCFSHVIVYDRSVIVATFSHGEDMRVCPLVYISPPRRYSHSQDPYTIIFLFDEASQEGIRPEVNISLACCLDVTIDVLFWPIRLLFSLLLSLHLRCQL